MSAMTLINYLEVGPGGQAQMEFTNIPQIYTDLFLVISAKTSWTPDTFVFVTPYINGSLNNTGKYLYGYNTTPYSANYGIGVALGANGVADTFAINTFHVADYASTTQHKAISIDGSTGGLGTSGATSFAANIYQSDTAITSFGVATSGNFIEYSSATLYGITAGSDGNTTVS